MARFLFTTWNFVGDTYSQMGIVHELMDRGHEVAYYNGSVMKELLESEGCTYFPYQAVNEEDVADAAAAMDDQPIGRQSARHVIKVLRRWLIDTFPDQVTDLEKIVKDWRPDVIVSSAFMYGPVLVLWEKTGIPVAVSSCLIYCQVPGPGIPALGPGLPPLRNWRSRLLSPIIQFVIDRNAVPLRRRVNEIRAYHGLPPLDDRLAAFPTRLPLYMIPTIRELDFNRYDLPPSVQYVGECAWNRPRNAEIPQWLTELPTDVPWVSATEGTLHYQDPFLLRATAQGLANLPMQVILTTGKHRRPEDLNLGPIAPNVRAEQWVPHAELLPKCSALIATGGAGTIMAALREGIPIVIVPTQWDKPDNAQRLVEAGVAIRISPKECTPQRLREAVERVLYEPSYRENARAIARKLAEAGGTKRAADLLEGLLKEPAGAGARKPARLGAGAVSTSKAAENGSGATAVSDSTEATASASAAPAQNGSGDASASSSGEEVADAPRA